MEKVRLGIIGIGNMGSFHIGNLKAGKCPEIELTAVADIDPARIRWAEENLPATVLKFDNAYDLLDCGKIDAALVAVPHFYHPHFAKECFRRHIHVMVEKPAGVYTRQVEEMNRLAKDAGVVFGMMFNQRTNHIYRKMREIVQSGELGSIRRTSWLITDWYRSRVYYECSPWRATWSGEGGGVLLNQCPHNLDLWQWICGMPVLVDAKVHYGKWHDIEVEDDVTAYVEYPNGATGTFITSTGDCPGSNRFEIDFDNGKLVTENGKLFRWDMEMPEAEWSRTNTEPFRYPKVTKTEVETDGQNTEHSGVLNAFAGAILRGEPLVAAGEEGIYGLTLSNAMHLSSWLGRPVQIPFDSELYYEELMKRVKTSRRPWDGFTG